MPKHLSKIQERGYESKSIQEGKEEEGIGERVDIERGRGQMSTEQAAFLLPAFLPACPGSIFGCALRYEIGGSPVINEGKFLPPLSTNQRRSSGQQILTLWRKKFLMLESTDYWIAEVRVDVVSHKKCLFKLHLQSTIFDEF